MSEIRQFIRDIKQKISSTRDSSVQGAPPPTIYSNRKQDMATSNTNKQKPILTSAGTVCATLTAKSCVSNPLSLEGPLWPSVSSSDFKSLAPTSVGLIPGQGSKIFLAREPFRHSLCQTKTATEDL